MSETDFPGWFGLGSYGGLACALVAPAMIALYALLRHCGTPRQIARASLVCLTAACLMLVPVWWNLNRLELYGPQLDGLEILLVLTWTAVLGWCVPIGTLVGYIALTAPQVPTSSGRASERDDGNGLAASLANPARQREPLGAGRPWGRLIPLEGPFAQQTLALTRQLVVLGREADNDIVIDDERTSRHHAELQWDHGRVQLVDGQSLNGTYVNQQPVRGPVLLRSGDVIELGAQRFRYESAQSTPLAQPAQDAQETSKLPGTARSDASASRHRIVPAQQLLLTAATPADGSPPSAAPTSATTWRLNQPLITVGRDSERTICLPHPSVSRLHAHIVQQPAGYFVADLHSSNGTTLNGQPLDAPMPLAPGDTVRFGEIELRCVLADGTPSGAPLPQQLHDAVAPTAEAGAPTQEPQRVADAELVGMHYHSQSAPRERVHLDADTLDSHDATPQP